MWIQEKENGKFKYYERYRDPYTEKWKQVTVTLDSSSNRAKKEAQKILDEKIEEVLRKLTTTDSLFHDIFDEWWLYHQKQIKKSSIVSIQAAINRIKDGIERGTKLANINVRLVQKLLDNDDWTYSQKYRIKTTLNTFFDYAISQDMIDENPSRKAKLPKKVTSISQKEQAKNKYLEPDEYTALLKELYRKDITLRYALACEFMLLNGCRIGELAGLTIDKYHPDARTLDIHTTYNRYIPDDNGTKTLASFRTINLTNREVEIIEKMLGLNNLSKTNDQAWTTSDRIFVTNTGKPIHSSILSRSLQRANERLDHPIPKHLSPHIFRHTMISILAENNIPLKTIMDRVGHADSQVTTSIYTHVTKNMKDQAINVLDGILKNRF